MRGKPLFFECIRAKFRITPAGAGKTLFRFILLSATVGSPPQVRGKPDIHCKRRWSSRITPAGAGKTALLIDMVQQVQDHPRRCGENTRFDCRNIRNRGSPPQVRGKHDANGNVTSAKRITPAGAGKTSSLFFNFTVVQDHPRRCGENHFLSPLHSFGLGSPPQVRGKRIVGYAQPALHRITPAGAGKTWQCTHYSRGK